MATKNTTTPTLKTLTTLRANVDTAKATEKAALGVLQTARSAWASPSYPGHDAAAYTVARDARDAAMAEIRPGTKGAPARREAVEAAYTAAMDAACGGVVTATIAATSAREKAELRLNVALGHPGLTAVVAETDRLAAQCLRADDLDSVIGAEPGVRVYAVTNWEKYSKAWHRSHGPATDHTTTITVRPDWRARVLDVGLAVCDGMLTLDAEPVAAPAGYTAWLATWAEQGRGYDARAVRGVIVRAEGRDARTAHVDAPQRESMPPLTPSKKLAKLREECARLLPQTYFADSDRSEFDAADLAERRLGAEERERHAREWKRGAPERERLAPLAAVDKGVALLRRRARSEWVDQASRNADLSQHRDARVTLADSRSVGNCDAGTRSWCARAGLTPENGATVGEVLDALAAGAGLDGMAIKACKHAVARHLARTAPVAAVAA